MATYDDVLPLTETKKPQPVEIMPDGYKHSIVDSSKRPLETLATYIGGSNWYVDYYSQILGLNEQPKPFDPKQHVAYQSYRKIHRYIVKLQGALQSTDEQGTGRMTQTGNMIITPYPGLTPNIGDAFVADIGEGVAGQFTVTTISKMTLNGQAAFNVDFQLSRVVDANIEQLLNKKVTEDLYYQKDYLILGENPLLSKTDFENNKLLENALKAITEIWQTRNFSHTVSTAILPNQPIRIYDQYVVKAMLKISSLDVHPNLTRLTSYNCDDFRITKTNSIYDVIIRRDKWLIHDCFKGFAVLNAGAMRVHVLQNSVKHSDVEFVIVPNTPNVDADNFEWLSKIRPTALGEINYTKGPGDSTGDGKDNIYCPADPNIPCTPCENQGKYPDDKEGEIEYGKAGDIGMDIPRISKDSYVLSKDFYSFTKEKCTLFERMLIDLLEDKHADKDKVVAFCNAYSRWGRLEQYYLTPFLICLIKSAIRGVG